MNFGRGMRLAESSETDQKCNIADVHKITELLVDMLIKYLSFVAAALLSACSTSVHLYPVEGPLTKSAPGKTIVATADGITGNTGNFKFVSAEGATCQGRWSSVAPQFAATSNTSLMNRYGSAVGYSNSVIVGAVPGVNKGQAFTVCSDGTRFDIEFYTGSGTANGYGIAKDTKGNIYKMIF